MADHSESAATHDAARKYETNGSRPEEEASGSDEVRSGNRREEPPEPPSAAEISSERDSAEPELAIPEPDIDIVESECTDGEAEAEKAEPATEAISEEEPPGEAESGDVSAAKVPDSDASRTESPTTGPRSGPTTATPTAVTSTAQAVEVERSPVAEQLAALVGDPSVVDRLTVTGPFQVLPSVFQVTTVAATAVAATAVGAARLFAARNGGWEPSVTVDTRHAAAAFRSERYITADRRHLPNPWDPLSGYYRTADDRWIQLHCNFPHHRDGVLSLFGLAPDRARLERAVSRADSEVLEGELQSMGMCATVSRTDEEWQAHSQGRALARLPLIEIERIGDAQPLAFVSSAKPAGGVRVLDMTRVIAGPVCGRVLASYGAQVVRVGAAHLPEVATVLVDTGFGKRNTNIDLRDAVGARRFRELVSSADVVIQAYRPKALARLGFGPEALARLRPGLVCVSISAYGRLGPWSGLRGFDSLVQTASGLAHAGGAAHDREPEAARRDPAVKPHPLPAQALDHATGYLGAYGAMTALARRQTEGGSWHVRLSLAQTGRWLRDLGPVDALDVPEPSPADVEPWLATMRSGLGHLSYVRPPGALSTYIPQWDSPPTPLGSAQPIWV